VEVFEDFQADVEPTRSTISKGPSVIEAELDGFVDVAAGDACFEHGEASLPMSALMRW